MTTSAPPEMTTPPPATPAKKLRRSRTDRIGAGVAGGLGSYFGVDPVLFRVLFATAAFFGGSGVLAYLLAWAAIPEEGTDRARVDGWVDTLRRRRVPVWLVAVAAVVLLWCVAFSWWAPGPFLPLVLVVIVLTVVFGRRRDNTSAPVAPAPKPPGSTAPVDLTKTEPQPQPTWSAGARAWVDESRAAGRERARRAFPVRITTLLVLVAALLTIGIVDAVVGVALPVYFWLGLGIVGGGLLVGLVLRRTPWSLTPLLVLSAIGLVAFAGTRAQLHDGVGERNWTPTSTIAPHYAVAFGRSTLDLRSLRAPTDVRVVRIDQAAGQVRIIAPKTMDLTVQAHVHAGTVTVDGENPPDGDSGLGVDRVVEPLAGTTGPAVTIDVHLADGRVDVERR